MVIIFDKCCMNNKVALKWEEGHRGTDVGGYPAAVIHSLTVFKCRRQLGAEIVNLWTLLKLSFECSSGNSAGAPLIIRLFRTGSKCKNKDGQ